MATAVCQETAARNKRDVKDFYSLYAASGPFTDSEFPHDAEAFFWEAAFETY